MQRAIQGTQILAGVASGEVLYADEGISLMGGVDPLTGDVIDTHHPLRGQNVAGKILAIPSGRGSCAGSGALFEMLHAGTAPAALVFCHEELILPVGAIIAQEFLGRSLPIVQVSPEEHARLRSVDRATVADGRVLLDESGESARLGATAAETAALRPDAVRLTARDREILDGVLGDAGAAAMRVIVQAAALEGVTELLDVELAHVDGNFYQGPGSVAFAEELVRLGARVQVPTTMNSLKVDRRRWRAQGVSPELGEPSERIADAYLAMGVAETYTCAPYWLADPPSFGEQIVWAESNAVVYANSVLGARTLKYPDYLDVLVAITGRAPAAGVHLPAARRATVQIDLEPLHDPDDSLFPMLGYLVGKLAPHDLPVVTGLEHSNASRDDLRAFGAALATTSAAPMFHMVGVTPEAPNLAAALGGDRASVTRIPVTRDMLRAVGDELTSATESEVGLVSFGNPHFSLTEIERLAEMCEGITLAAGVELMVTCGREIHRLAMERGFVERIERIGGRFITDTCWCLIQEPVIPPNAVSVMTNSAKYAHYGPAQIGRGMHFGSFAECLTAAQTGFAPVDGPAWLG